MPWMMLFYFKEDMLKISGKYLDSALGKVSRREWGVGVGGYR